ncbi:MAG: xylulokinase [Actinomycetales bacterium]|nr:xylulokinase [Actinomycetales bacterium]
MALVAGVDSSTQSVKIVVRDSETGALVREAKASHPDGTEVHPSAWLDALDTAMGGILEGVEALAVAGQQHGMVALDEEDAVVRPALLWNDTRSAPDADDLVEELGGPQAWADAVGSVPLAAFTVTKARWMARVEPENAARTTRMMLPHDYLTWVLAGRPDTAVTDRGEASGTGYWSPITGQYRKDLLELALGHVPLVPRVAAPHEEIGRTSTGIALGPGTGDNMGAALGLELQPGDVVVSLGTSGTAFAVSTVPARDASGLVAGFADATGRFLPLVCTLNAARVLTSTAEMLGVDMDEFARLALSAPAGAEGLALLPYLDGERTPNLPDARGSLHGISRANMTPATIARAAVEGMLGGLADAVDALIDVGVQPRRILLVGGAAANPAVGAVAATMFPAQVVIPPPGEYVADGAARQAAWVLAGGDAAPTWDSMRQGETLTYDAEPVAAVREQYRAARTSLYG